MTWRTKSVARHKKRYVKSRGLVEIRNKFNVFDDELEERPELEKNFWRKIQGTLMGVAEEILTE